MRPKDWWTAVAAAGAFLALAAVGDARHVRFLDLYYLVVASAMLFVAVRRLRHIDDHWWEY